MKVCFDYEIFFKEKFGSISSRYFFNIIKILSNINNVDIRVFSKFYLNTKLDELSKQIVIGNRIKFKPPFTGKIFQKINSVFLNYQIKNFCPQIIHKTYYSKNLHKKDKIRIVLTVMDLWHEKNSKNNYRPKMHSLQISDHILCPSISTKNDLINIYNINEKKITVTYLGIEKFENIKSNKINITKYEKPFLLFVGARGRYKNFNNFLKVFANSKILSQNFNIVCFGGGNFSFDEINLIKRLKVFNSVCKEKNEDDLTLYHLYKNAKCLVYPSSHEGLGLPTLEAMSLGCPVISGNHPGILEAVGDAAVTFDPNNILQVQKVLEEYIYSDKKLANLKNLGLLQARKFSWDKCAKETLEIYKKLLN